MQGGRLRVARLMLAEKAHCNAEPSVDQRKILNLLRDMAGL